MKRSGLMSAAFAVLVVALLSSSSFAQEYQYTVRDYQVLDFRLKLPRKWRFGGMETFTADKKTGMLVFRQWGDDASPFPIYIYFRTQKVETNKTKTPTSAYRSEAMSLRPDKGSPRQINSKFILADRRRGLLVSWSFKNGEVELIRSVFAYPVYDRKKPGFRRWFVILMDAYAQKGRQHARMMNTIIKSIRRR